MLTLENYFCGRNHERFHECWHLVYPKWGCLEFSLKGGTSPDNKKFLTIEWVKFKRWVKWLYLKVTTDFNLLTLKIDLRCVSDLYHVSAFRDVFKTQSNIYGWAFSQISRFSLWLYWQTLILSCIEIVAQTILVYAQRYLNTPSKQNVRFSLFFNPFSVLQVLNNQCNWFLNQGIHLQMLWWKLFYENLEEFQKKHLR